MDKNKDTSIPSIENQNSNFLRLGKNQSLCLVYYWDICQCLQKLWFKIYKIVNENPAKPLFPNLQTDMEKRLLKQAGGIPAARAHVAE